MSEEPFDAEVAELEAALRKLAPIGGTVSRDRILFRAGQSAARRRWLTIGAMGVVLGAGLALASGWSLKWFLTGPPEVIYAKEPVDQPAPAPANQPGLSPAELAARWQELANYLQLEEELSRRGLEALPMSPEPQTDQRLSLDQLLGAS
jgi:hypothetical protein